MSFEVIVGLVQERLCLVAAHCPGHRSDEGEFLFDPVFPYSLDVPAQSGSMGPKTRKLLWCVCEKVDGCLAALEVPPLSTEGRADAFVYEQIRAALIQPLVCALGLREFAVSLESWLGIPSDVSSLGRTLSSSKRRRTGS
jgi:hypothetical protein